MSAPSISDIMTAMTEAVEMDGQLRKKFNAVVLFHVQEASTPCLVDARKSRNNDNQPKPDLQVTTSEETLQDLLAQKTTPQKAFMKGQLKIKGNMGLAMKLKAILDATRKQLAVTTARL